MKIDKRRLAFLLLVLIGSGLILLAFGADHIGVERQSGFGLKQKLIVLAGAGSVFIGLLGMSPAGEKLANVFSSQPEERKRPVPFILVLVWFALVTGLFDVSLLAYRKSIILQEINRSKHFPWMVPTGYLIIFLSFGAVLLLVRRLVKRPPERVEWFLLSLLGFISVAFNFSQIRVYALCVLSIGLAFQASSLIGKYRGGFHWLVRYSTPVLLMGVGLMAGGFLGWQGLVERRAVEALPPAREGGPNVLLIVMDTVRAKSLSLYGYKRPTTPNLERLAREGVVFDYAFSTAPWTLPTHASMFTGRWHSELSVSWYTQLDKFYPTLAEELASQGYLTGGFAANIFYCSYEFGLDRGFAHYEDYPITPMQILITTSVGRKYQEWNYERSIGNRLLSSKNAGDVNRAFLNWVSKNSQRPFFAFLNYFDAHLPYLPPKPFDEMFGSQSLRVRWTPESSESWTEEQYQADINAYDGSIAYLDFEIGRFIDELDRRGLKDNTLIIITSDHGESLGEHQLYEHGNSLYVETLHVPLLMIFPSKLPSNDTVAEPVSLRDIPQTIFDLVSIPSPQAIPGKSLAGYLGQPAASEDSASEMILAEVYPGPPVPGPISRGEIKSLMNGEYQYILNGDGGEELYDYVVDPMQIDNIASETGNEEKLEMFRASLRLFFNKLDQQSSILQEDQVLPR